jgi:hypothetical protein
MANDNLDMLTWLSYIMIPTISKLRVGVIEATAEMSQTNFCILEWNSTTRAFMQ